MQRLKRESYFVFSLGTQSRKKEIQKNQKKKEIQKIRKKIKKKKIQKNQEKEIQKKRKKVVFSSPGQNVRPLSLPYS